MKKYSNVEEFNTKYSVRSFMKRFSKVVSFQLAMYIIIYMGVTAVFDIVGHKETDSLTILIGCCIALTSVILAFVLNYKEQEGEKEKDL